MSARRYGGYKEIFFVLKKIVATLFFSGYAPVAPGTAGSALTAIVYYFFCSSMGAVEWFVVLTAVFFVGVYTAGEMERKWGRDPGRVVIDEGMGFLLTVAFLPHGFWTAVLGFLLFRLLDILKPAPIRRVERLPGGWGIVADDVMAGLYGNAVLRTGLELAGAN